MSLLSPLQGNGFFCSNDPSPPNKTPPCPVGRPLQLMHPFSELGMDIPQGSVPVEATDAWAFYSIPNPATCILIKTITWVFSCLFWKILGHKSQCSKESKITHYLFMWLLRFQESFLLLASFCLCCGYSKKSFFIPWILFFLESLPAIFFIPTPIFTLSRRGEFTSIDKELQKTRFPMNCPKLPSQAAAAAFLGAQIPRSGRCVQGPEPHSSTC